MLGSYPTPRRQSRLVEQMVRGWSVHHASRHRSTQPQCAHPGRPSLQPRTGTARSIGGSVLRWRSGCRSHRGSAALPSRWKSSRPPRLRLLGHSSVFSLLVTKIRRYVPPLTVYPFRWISRYSIRVPSGSCPIEASSISASITACRSFSALSASIRF